MLLPVDRRLRAAVAHANRVPFFFFFLAFQSLSFRTYPARLIIIKKSMFGISREGFSGRHTFVLHLLKL